MQVPFAELCLLVFCFEMSVGSLLPQSPDEGICFRVGQSNFDQQPLWTAKCRMVHYNTSIENGAVSTPQRLSATRGN